MERKIIIDSANLNSSEIAALLEGIEFANINIENADTATRAGDASVVTALVSSALGFIISLLGIFKKKDLGEITIVGKSGWQVKVPAGTPPEEITKYIDAAKEKDIELITI